jgi:hypothetical protein
MKKKMVMKPRGAIGHGRTIGEEVDEPRGQEAAGIGAEDSGGCPPSGIGGAASCCYYADNYA